MSAQEKVIQVRMSTARMLLSHLQGKLSVTANAAAWVQHANFQGKVSQVGDNHFFLPLSVVLRVHIDAVDRVVKDLQVAARAGQLLWWDHAVAWLRQRDVPRCL